MNEYDILIDQAVREYEQDGIVSASTHALMSSYGLDATAIIEDIEETS